MIHLINVMIIYQKVLNRYVNTITIYIYIYILNSKQIFNIENNIILKDKYEINKEQLKELRKYSSNLFSIDIINYLDIFYECRSFHNQYNTYKRILVSRICQKLNKTMYKNNKIKRCMILDEDSYCNGNIDKLYNIQFENNKYFYGFIENTINHIIQNFYRIQHINCGLLILDIKFNLNSDIFIKYLNIAIILNTIEFKYVVDQFIINSMLNYQYIPLKINKDILKKIDKYINKKYIWGIYGIFELEQYNICHYAKTYDVKNQMKLLIIFIINLFKFFHFFKH